MKKRYERSEKTVRAVVGSAGTRTQEREKMCRRLMLEGAIVFDCGVCPMPAIRLGKDVCRAQTGVYLGSSGSFVWGENIRPQKMTGRIVTLRDMNELYARSLFVGTDALKGLAADVTGDFASLLSGVLRSMGCAVGKGIRLELGKDGTRLKVNSYETPTNGDAMRSAVLSLTCLKRAAIDFELRI